jgi:hypothetical protein
VRERFEIYGIDSGSTAATLYIFRKMIFQDLTLNMTLNKFDAEQITFHHVDSMAW